VENQPTDAQVDGCEVKQKLSPEAAQHAGEMAVKMILEVIGEDYKREGLLDTPKRVVKSWKEIFAGYKQDPKAVLGTTFEKGQYDQMVICKDIELYSTCEHHMIPFFGKAHIGYIPGEKVVGLSKLARLVEVFARRLQIQEKLTDEIATTLEEVLKPRGVMVVIEAKHMCMCARGVGKQNSWMVTSSIKGLFKEKEAREEFLALKNGN
jgi:GTP cyclohydrolase I